MVDLGSNAGANAAVTLTLTQDVPAGQLVVVSVAGGSNTGGGGTSSVVVTDSVGNTYLMAASENGADTFNAVAAIAYTLLAQPLPAGATITATFDNNSARNALWAIAASNVQILDQQGTNVRTSSPTVSTGASVTDTVGLVVGGALTGSSTAATFTGPSGYADGATWSASRSSGIFGYKTSTSLTGTQAYAPTPSTTGLEFLSVVASFKPGTPASPSNLSLNHTTRMQTFTVSWSGGRGSGGAGGCDIEYNKGGTWTRLTSGNCDVNTTNQTVTLPTTAGWVANWSAPVSVRLARRHDGTSLAAFSQDLTCSAAAASATPTPTEDEDCDGTWDNATCSTYAWATATFTCTAPNCGACTSFSQASVACDASTLATSRYTDGVLTTSDPAAITSYSSASNQCGSNSHNGAVKWTCGGTACSYF